MSETRETPQPAVVLCPGQGAQQVGMGRAWAEASDAAHAIFRQADSILRDHLATPLSEICFEGPAELLNRTEVSQPAIFTCSVASLRGLEAQGLELDLVAGAGLSLGEYTALHLAGAFDFETGLTLVAKRGRLMQEAAEASEGGMVALIGADEEQAAGICERVERESGGVLVCANFNAPGQIVLSGDKASCRMAVEIAAEAGLRATPLTVAGAFHSPLMQPAADGLAEHLASIDLQPLEFDIWANVTARPHDRENVELLRQRLVEQLVSPVRWAQLCLDLVQRERIHGTSQAGLAYHELAPGTVLRGLMRRIERERKVMNHDEPE